MKQQQQLHNTNHKHFIVANIKEELMEGAKAKGICHQGYERMMGSDIDALVDYYIEHPDWCMSRGFPTLDVIKGNFSGIEDKGVFVGKTFHGETLNDLQTYIFHGCKGTIRVGLNVDKAIIPMLYLANGCRLRIIGAGDFRKPLKSMGRSVVPIYTFGRNDLSAKDNKYVRFTLHKTELS